MKPSLRCAKALHVLALCLSQREQPLAALIAEETRCDELQEALEMIVKCLRRQCLANPSLRTEMVQEVMGILEDFFVPGKATDPGTAGTLMRHTTNDLSCEP